MRRSHPRLSRFQRRLRQAQHRQTIIALGFWHVDTPPDAKAHHTHYIDGHVYFGRGPAGAIKIGCSIEPAKRARAQNAELLAVIPYGGRFEVFLHHYFDGFNVGGEWFSPEPPLLALIDRVNRVFPQAAAA